MVILGIESSCDDTSIALVHGEGDCVTVLKEKTASQIAMHAQYGGVVPEVAARIHAETIIPLLDDFYDEEHKPDVIAVTTGPGLMTSLMVGVETARLLSYFTDIPVVAVNHIAGHVYSNFIGQHEETPKFPILCLVVSGGHTELILMKSHLSFEKIGATIDDAAGECFDKVAKMLGLTYPGGPKISALAKTGNRTAHVFPRPLLDKPDYNFSFSGLKTSALYFLRDNQSVSHADFAASIEEAIVQTLVTKTIRAAQQYQVKTIFLAGGVAANAYLRETLSTTIAQKLPEVTFHMPPLTYCMDNAAMIASAGYFMAKATMFTPWQDLRADSGWEL